MAISIFPSLKFLSRISLVPSVIEIVTLGYLFEKIEIKSISKCLIIVDELPMLMFPLSNFANSFNEIMPFSISFNDFLQDK